MALFQAKVDQCQADLLNAVAAQEKEKTSQVDALRTLNRYKTLHKENLVSQNDLDQAQVKYDLSLALVKAAEAQIGTAKANLDSAKTNLKYSTIRSPVKGTVVNRNVCGSNCCSQFIGPDVIHHCTRPYQYAGRHQRG